MRLTMLGGSGAAIGKREIVGSGSGPGQLGELVPGCDGASGRPLAEVRGLSSGLDRARPVGGELVGTATGNDPLEVNPPRGGTDAGSAATCAAA